MKSKGIPKYQRDELRQPGPIPLLTNTFSHTLCPPLASMLWGSILYTKDLSTLFDQYMHFHHSALFCLYNKAGGYKEVVIHSSVRFNSTSLLHLLLMLVFVLCYLHILWVIAFKQMIYLCELSSLSRLIYEAFMGCRFSISCSWLTVMEVILCYWLVKDFSVTH